MKQDRDIFNFSTAYGQLILLVFLPILLLAVVGGVLVLNDTRQAARTSQKATANILLDRYLFISQDLTVSLDMLNQDLKKKNNQLTSFEKQELQQNIKNALQDTVNDKHLLGMAIFNHQHQPLLTFGELDEPHLTIQYPNIKTPLKQQKIYPLGSNHQGTLYGKPLLINNLNQPDHQTILWFVVNMDNEPLKVALYQVILALAITGLLTLLLLLLSVNIYSRRWIAPIYEMRLYLQRSHSENLSEPMNIVASGELHELQQDLVKTFQRLHSSFQELKKHAEQTEDDLQHAFDEMEMQNISIRNARDAAISANQTKSAFLANISHELRTPLNSIDGFINLLSRHAGLTPEQDLYVQTIRKSSAHLLALVNDVLDFSKIEAGKLVLDTHEFDLYSIIYDVVDMLSPVAAEKNLRLAVFFYDDVPQHLTGDTLRIKQVLTNLVNNAIKFTDEGEVVVRVSLDELDEQQVHISVQDTGRGIDLTHQKLLFQSFSQGDPSITRQYGGTGLGLVISKQLTQLMGGHIGFYDNASKQQHELQNSVGQHLTKTKGSTFWFTLPIHHQNSNQQPNQTWQFPSVFTNQGYPASNMGDKRMHILVWITHLASLQVLKGTLQQLPVDIVTANSLAGLLQSLKEIGNRWDWVIVDNAVPDDTVSLLKQIRLHYAGKLALFDYQINLDYELLSRYQVKALYQPLDRRQLYQVLDNDNKPTIEPTLPKWHGFRVLTVDDHLPNLLVLEALLAELGIEVVTANSGFDAIDYITKTQNQPEKAVDLIFMDIQMPRMSGSEAASQIRKIEKNDQRVPIIALTAHSLSDEREKLLSSGIDDYVGKPISQTQLLQILQRWLGKQGVQQDFLTSTTPTQEDTLKPSDDNLPIIDWEDALQRAAGKEDLASNLIIMMIDLVEKEKADLQAAWQQQDRQSLAEITHRILGASRYTGVPALRQASQNLEDKCLNQQLPLNQLATDFEHLIHALNDLAQVDLSKWQQLKYARLTEQEMTWKMI